MVLREVLNNVYRFREDVLRGRCQRQPQSASMPQKLQEAPDAIHVSMARARGKGDGKGKDGKDGKGKDCSSPFLS